MNVNATGPTISRVTGLSVHYQNYQFVRSRWNGNCRTTVRHELLVTTRKYKFISIVNSC